MYRSNATVHHPGMLTALIAILATTAATAQVANTVPASPPVHRDPIVPKALTLAPSDRPTPTVVIGPVDDKTLLAEDEQTAPIAPLRCGILRQVSSTGVEAGEWHLLDDGTWLWILGVRSVGARGLRIHLQPTGAPVAGRVLIHGMEAGAEVVGPFDFASVDPQLGLYTPTLDNDTAFVECWIQEDLERPPLDLGFRIDGIVHQYRDMSPQAGPLSSSGLLPCHLDATCFPDWKNEANAVARIDYVDPPGNYICSSSLLSRIPGDKTPLLMTAHHCGVSPVAAASLQVTWLYQTATCNGTSISAVKTVGATALRESPGMDIRLLGLLTPVPAGVTYAGWNAGLVWPDGSIGTVIHHPNGSFKRLTMAQKFAETGANCVGANAFEFKIPVGAGEIQPGSSGSPIFDAQHRVKGVTSCGTSANCSTVDYATFGRLDYAFPNLQPFLAPTDPVFVKATNNGFANGSAANPFAKLIEGVFAVIAGHDLYVTSGTYGGSYTIYKPMTINALAGVVTIGG